MNQQYEDDFYAWTNDQADLLKKKEFERLDMENLIEEIESLGNSNKFSLESYLIILLLHKLKLEYHPKNDEYKYNTRSWSISVGNSEDAILLIVEYSPSLKKQLRIILNQAYKKALKKASRETNLPITTFPKECPWELKKLFPDLEEKYW